MRRRSFQSDTNSLHNDKCESVGGTIMQNIAPTSVWKQVVKYCGLECIKQWILLCMMHTDTP